MKPAKNEFDEKQRFDILRPSNSPYSSPLHIVPEKQIDD